MVLEYVGDLFDYKPKVLELLKRDAYKKGEFTLSSGRKSEHYVNCKPVTLNGMGLTWLSKSSFLAQSLITVYQKLQHINKSRQKHLPNHETVHLQEHYWGPLQVC